jgi:hypothetical protein
VLKVGKKNAFPPRQPGHFFNDQSKAMALIAYRGGTQLRDEIELKAYLASLLRLENVGVLLGAGASCSAGGRTVKAMWEDFVVTSPIEAAWLHENLFIQEANLYLPPRDPLLNEAEAPNVEALADSLEIAIVEWTRRSDIQLKAAKKARAALFRAVLRAAILRPEWWTSPTGVDVTADKLEHHRAILQKLTSARQPGQAPPWVFTTNYDLAIEWAAESVDMQVINGFLGLHGRGFSPQSFDLGLRNIQARGEARFGVYNIYLAKLHGSLTWKEVSGNMYEVPAAQAWPDLEAFLDGRTDDLGYLVLPRAAKYLQTIGFVLGELLRRFAEFMSRPQTALIIVGYGFGDEHINRLVRSALLNPTLQIVIYLPEFTGVASNAAIPPTVRRLLSLQNPRLTIVGGGDQAFLSKLAQQLPDPAIYDESLKDLEKKLRPLTPDAEEAPDQA